MGSLFLFFDLRAIAAVIVISVIAYAVFSLASPLDKKLQLMGSFIQSASIITGFVNFIFALQSVDDLSLFGPYLAFTTLLIIYGCVLNVGLMIVRRFRTDRLPSS